MTVCVRRETSKKLLLDFFNQIKKSTGENFLKVESLKKSAIYNYTESIITADVYLYIFFCKEDCTLKNVFKFFF